MVVTQIDSALHPESIAVLAGEVVSSQTAGGGSVLLGSFEPIRALRADAAPLRADSALVTLLRWSDKPLEVFLDDEQSPVARVPPADRRGSRRSTRRCWCRSSPAAASRGRLSG